MSSDYYLNLKDENDEPPMERIGQGRSLPSVLNHPQQRGFLPSSSPYPHNHSGYPPPDLYPHGPPTPGDQYHDPFSPVQQYTPYGQAYQIPASYSNYLPPLGEHSRMRAPREHDSAPPSFGEPSYPHMQGLGYSEGSYEYGRSLPRTLGPHDRSGWSDGEVSFHDTEEQQMPSYVHKAFSRTGTPKLTEARRTNRPEKKFVCTHQDCDRSQPGNGFTTPNDLDRHKRSVHKEKGTYFQCRDRTCTDSGKFFARRDNFVDHLKRMHKFADEDDMKNKLHRYAKEWTSEKDDSGRWVHLGSDQLHHGY